MCTGGCSSTDSLACFAGGRAHHPCAPIGVITDTDLTVRLTSVHASVVRSRDCGGEFIGAAFMEHLRAKGIKVQHSPAGTPTSNARIKRLRNTLFPRLHVVLHKRGLPLNLWPRLAMIIDGIVYTYNRLPCAAIGDKIPFEL